MPPTDVIEFTKMNGAGNDFVVLDRSSRALPGTGLVQAFAHRQFGVGCDQVMVVQAERKVQSGFGYLIFNADGSRAEQCGNGARCVAAWLIRKKGLKTPFVLMSPSGPVHVNTLDAELSVQLSVPQFEPKYLPFRADAQAQTYQRTIKRQPVEFSCVSMGNPHVVILVPESATAQVELIGSAFQHHADFPQRANVGFAQLRSESHISLRVYERGVGETLACGSGACAAVAALCLRGLLRFSQWIRVDLPGGSLRVFWPGPGQSVTLSGPAEFVFEGCWPL